MIEECPYCGELLEIPSPELGGPLTGEMIRCSTCAGTFLFGQSGERQSDMVQGGEPVTSGLGSALKRIFFQLGEMVTGFVSAVLMLLVIVFWAFILFLTGWVFGDEVFGALKWVFS